MWHCHSSPYGGHHSGPRTAAKVLQSGFFWPTLFKDCVEFVQRLNFDAGLAGEKRLLKLNELEEWRLQAYENA
ncbi:hypothetical protein A2U01_0039273, partial [Trifolium medium]|nr:hypothetical protein [Trifolium medium]